MKKKYMAPQVQDIIGNVPNLLYSVSILVGDDTTGPITPDAKPYDLLADEDEEADNAEWDKIEGKAMSFIPKNFKDVWDD